MAWVIDTCVLLDVILGDPQFAPGSAATLNACQFDGLIVCPVTMIELAPVFLGDWTAQEQFLTSLQIRADEPWTDSDTQTAHCLWNGHIVRKRLGATSKRPIADIQIAAFAGRFQGLITRNGADFRSLCPNLTIRES